MFESTVVCGRIALGIQGEHHARKVSFAETQLWKERFGEGRFELLHQRNGDVAPYPINMTIENDVPYWYVTNSDTAVAGVGKCELRYIVNDVVIKSCTFITDVDASLGEGTEAPEPYKAWVDEVLEAAEDVKEATVHQPIIGENGNWFVYDLKASGYVDTGTPAVAGDNDEITEHLSNSENPHKVTAEQTGAYTKEAANARFADKSTFKVINDNTTVLIGATHSSGGKNENTIIGYKAGEDVNDLGNTIIGARANTTAKQKVQKAVVIGRGAIADKSNQAVLGSDSITETLLKGNIVVRDTNGTKEDRPIIFNEDGTITWKDDVNLVFEERIDDIEEQLGDVETALDIIIEFQEDLVGGEN